ncbi:MAG: hypothetical protein ACLR9W_02360 [Enterobacter hormaechei]
MLNIKQREERETRGAKREFLREELAFAVDKNRGVGKLGVGLSPRAACEKHGGYQRISLGKSSWR